MGFQGLGGPWPFATLPFIVKTSDCWKQIHPLQAVESRPLKRVNSRNSQQRRMIHFTRCYCSLDVNYSSLCQGNASVEVSEYPLGKIDTILCFTMLELDHTGGLRVFYFRELSVKLPAERRVRCKPCILATVYVLHTGQGSITVAPRT